ncbi:hypothetical protein HGM15179_008461 [Zosterops borbonicus]|uniref:Uncharacterized protein n=1 Tax=Zosterops borbonicus TaxID=364589 RepID=A0A8K1GJD0_9PASS|nr:hypothetical protein HGM15179_008461 [Zosterops borbonicus]
MPVALLFDAAICNCTYPKEWGLLILQYFLNTEYEYEYEYDFATIIISFDETAPWMDEGRVVDIVYLEFRKAFDTVLMGFRQDPHGQTQKVWTGVDSKVG